VAETGIPRARRCRQSRRILCASAVKRIYGKAVWCEAGDLLGSAILTKGVIVHPDRRAPVPFFAGAPS